MDEIIAQVSEKTGLSTENSRIAVTTVIDWVKGKLPEGIRGQVDGYLAGDGDVASAAKGALGGLLGG